MITIGKYNTLQANRVTPQGYYLADADGNEVLLPNAFVPEGFQEGDEIEVFIYNDSEDRPVATTTRPLAVRGDFAVLEVGSVTPIGAFLKWGLPKDLFVPKALQKRIINEGDKQHVVYIMLDEVTFRLVGTTHLTPYLDNSAITDLQVGEEVEVIVFDKTKLGFKVVVNQLFEGLIYQDEIFQPVSYGDKLKAYVKKIREDQKLDLTLEKFGYRKVEPVSEKVLNALQANKGFLPLHDKSTPEEIKSQLHISKKSI